MAKKIKLEKIKDYNIYSKRFYKTKKALKRGLAIFATSFVAVIVIAVVLVTATWSVLMSKIKRADWDRTLVAVPSGADEVYGSNDIINIALYGIDSRYVDEPSRSDAIMILTVDKEHCKIKLTSIARDTYVDIQGHGKDKINHAYIFGGPVLALSTLNNAFNLNVHDYATANFWALADIINYVGGVDIDVDSAERYDINKNYIPWMKSYGIECDYIPGTGVQHLNGGQAVSYCRVRHVGGDVMRGERQREVLLAMYDKVKDLPFYKYPDLVSLVLKECTTSLSDSQILSIVTWAGANMGKLKIETLGLPDKDLDKGGQMIRGVWYYVYDLDTASKKIEKFILETGD